MAQVQRLGFHKLALGRTDTDLTSLRATPKFANTVGLTLDVVMRPAIAGRRQGRDELRDRAAELILQAPAAN